MQRPHFFRYPSLFSIVFLLGIANNGFHPFFISVTELRLDSPKKTCTIACRMFTDDLQQALFKNYQFKAELEKGDPSAQAYLAKYMGERLQVKVAGQPIVFNFVGFETEEEATWVYLEASNYPGTGKVEVINTLLYDFISAQTNLVHLYRDGNRTSTKLTNPEKYAVFD